MHFTDFRRSEALLGELATHQAGHSEMPELLRGAFMARDRVMLISTEPVRRAAEHFCDLVEEPGAPDVSVRREAFRRAAIDEFKGG
jgi:hypothetical protein